MRPACVPLRPVCVPPRPRLRLATCDSWPGTPLATIAPGNGEGHPMGLISTLAAAFLLLATSMFVADQHGKSAAGSALPWPPACIHGCVTETPAPTATATPAPTAQSTCCMDQGAVTITTN